MTDTNAIVTGATGGIGKGVVDALAAAGYRVIALGRSREKLDALGVESVVHELGTPIDLGLERLDALVHCAGIAEVASLEDTPPQLWEETFAANVSGPAALTRDLLPALRAARGHVVFVNLASRMHDVANWSAYMASKAALRELADSLRAEEARNGVRVTSIYPGGVRTELLRKVREQFGQPYDPAVTISPQTFGSLVLSILEFPADAQILDVSLRARS